MGIRNRKGTPGSRLFPSRMAVVRLGAARLAPAALAAACTATAGLANETADAPTLGGSSPPAEAIEHYSDGLRALEAQDFRSAAFEFEAATATDSTYGDAFYALGKTYKTLGQFDRAIGALLHAQRLGVSLERAMNAIPSQLAAAYSKSGLEAYQKHKYREAIGAFEQALELRPGDARIHYTVGLSHLRLRDEDAAKTAFQQAIEADPEYVRPYRSLGDIHKQKREFGPAAEAYKQAIAIDSTFTDAYSGLARVQIATENFAAAESTLRHAVAIDGEFAHGFMLLGHSLIQLTRYHEAIDPLRRSIDLDGKKAETHYRLAEAYYGMGEYRKVAEAARSAMRRRRDYVAAWVVLADSLHKLGEVSEARTWYTKASSDSRFKDYCTYKLKELSRPQ